MKSGIECYGFRCNLTIKDITLYNLDFPDTKESRNQMFNNFFSTLEENRTLESKYETRKYILIYKEKIKDVIHCQIARKREVSINKYNEGNITETKEEDYPYVNIFIELFSQKILIESNSLVFDNVDTCKKVLENIMGNYFRKYDIVVEIHPIIEKSDFKKVFDEGKINKITFELNVPNWGNAASAAKELAEDSKKMGAEKITYSLTNNDGNIIYNDDMDSFVKYVSDGSGTWKIKGRDNSGKRFDVQSGDKKKKIVVNTTKEEINKKLDESELMLIMDAFNKIEKIERLREDYE